ncbi:MAG: ABC transporter permease [Oscillospiraceae bacterium]|nr:ABC transporter permease [Oscillospiraceae bacterium]
MFLIENIRLALGALLNNKVRAFLTMLGIIIGVSSVITITTIGNSLKETLQNSFNILGEQGFYVNYSVKPDENGDHIAFSQVPDDQFLTKEILEDMEKDLDYKYLVSQSSSLGEGMCRNYKEQNVNCDIMCVSEGWFCALSKLIKVKEGRQLKRDDYLLGKNAVLVSDVFVQQYFSKEQNPIGQTIDLDVQGVCHAKFVIVGVYAYPKLLEKQQVIGAGLMDRVTEIFIPYNTGLRLGAVDLREYRYPGIYSSDISMDQEQAKMELQKYFDEKMEKSMMRVSVESDSDDLKDINTVLNYVTLVIVFIAAISLLVGGIGVMNIMLVSITERTREIGVRKAIGARSSVIKSQFLIEAVILCLIGGMIGVLLGIGNGVLIGYVVKTVFMARSEASDYIVINISPSPSAILISLGFSMLIGVFFGSYPASRAANMNPIDALRYE